MNTKSEPKKQKRMNAKPAMQARSTALREAFIKAGFSLLNERSLDSLSIPDIASRAKSSVGGFYSRFKNKEAFFLCLRDEQVSMGVALVDRNLPITIFETGNIEEIAELIVDTYTTIFTGNGRGVLRETFMRLNHSPELWEPMRQNGRYAADYLSKHLGPRLGTNGEERVRFLVQVMMSVLVNDLVNPNHPFKPGQPEFKSYLLELLMPFLKSTQTDQS